MPLTIQSDAFTNNGQIPQLHTCQSKDISPPLSWKGIPQGTKSFVLIVDDPDAPDPKAPKMTWVHWIVYNIPSTTRNLLQDSSNGNLPAGALIGTNDWKKPEYGGPCPPIGRHRYFFKLYALKEVLPDLNHPTKEEIEKAMDGKILAKAECVGTYQKQ